MRHLLLAGLLLAGSPVFSQQPATPPLPFTPAPTAWDAAAERTFEIACKFRIDALKGKSRIAWVPVPHSDADQEVLSVVLDGGFPETRVTDPETGTQFMRVDFSKAGEKDSAIAFRYRVNRRAVRALGAPPRRPADPAPLARWKTADRLGPIDGKVAEEAKRVVGHSADPMSAARSLFENIVGGAALDKSAPGWGTGDVLRMLEMRKGNSADLHALFVAEARSLGIPARMVTGILLPEGRERGPVAGYHTWAEFHLDGRGWVPLDAAEAVKHPDRKEACWGALEANRVALGVGRDVRVPGAADGEPLNFPFRPYVELDGKPAGEVPMSVAFDSAPPKP